jgi:hypothetical protein
MWPFAILAITCLAFDATVPGVIFLACWVLAAIFKAS